MPQNETIRVILDPARAIRGGRRVERALGGIESAADRMQRRITVGVAALGVAATAAIGVSVREIARLQTSVAEITTLFDSTSTSIGTITQTVREQTNVFGGSAITQAEAYYGIVSSGAMAGAEATQLLTDSNRLAIAGVTSVATASDGLTSSLNAYGESASSAVMFSDILFATVAEGKTTIDELASSVGGVAPTAAALGVSFQELNAGVAALTSTGLSTNQAFTRINAVLTAVLKPSSQATDLAEDLGLEFNVAGIRARGLAGFLEDVTKATRGNSAQMATLFGRSEAIAAVLSLTGTQADKFRDSLDVLTNSAGATEEAYQKVINTAGIQFGRVISTTTNLFARILTPAVNASIPVLRTVADSIIVVTNNLDTLAVVLGTITTVLLRNFIVSIVSAGVAAIASAAQVGALVLSFGAANAGAIALSSAVGVLRGALNLLIANPFVAITVAIGTAVTALTLMESNTERVNRVTQATTASVNELKQAYDLTTMSLANLNELDRDALRLRFLGEREEALQATREGINNIREDLQALSVDVDRSANGLQRQNMNIANSYDQIVDSFENGRTTIQEFHTALVGIRESGELNEMQIMRLNAVIAALSSEVGKPITDTNRLNASLRVLDGTATDADRALLGLTGTISGVGAAARGATGEVASLEDVLSQVTDELRDFVPEFRIADGIRDELAEAEASAKVGRDAVAAALSAGDISFETATMQLAQIDMELENARRGITTTTSTTNSLTDAQQRLASIIDLAQGGVSGLEEQISDLNNAYATNESRVASLQISTEQYLGTLAVLNEQLRETRADRVEEQIDALNSQIRRGVGDIDANREALARLRGELPTFRDDFLDAVDEISESARRPGEILGETFKTATDEVTSAIVKLAETGDISFRDLGRSIARTALQLSTNNLVGGLFTRLGEAVSGGGSGGSGGNFLSRLFGGGRGSQGNTETDASGAANLSVPSSIARVNSITIGSVGNIGTGNSTNADGVLGNLLGKDKANEVSRSITDGSESSGGILGGLFGRAGENAGSGFLNSIFGALTGGGGGGFLGPLFGLLGGGFGGLGGLGSSGIFNGLFGGAGLFGFANGGDFRVGGSGGTDSQVVRFRASPNEHVLVETPEQRANRLNNFAMPNVNVQSNTDVQVTVENHASGVRHEVRQMSPGEVRVIAREVVATETDGIVGRNLGDPNSRTSQGLARNTQAGRSF